MAREGGRVAECPSTAAKEVQTEQKAAWNSISNGGSWNLFGCVHVCACVGRACMCVSKYVCMHVCMYACMCLS